MKTNVGKLDKIARLSLAGIIVILFALKAISGTLGLVLLGVALILAATSLLNFCPLYSIFKLSTKKK